MGHDQVVEVFGRRVGRADLPLELNRPLRQPAVDALLELNVNAGQGLGGTFGRQRDRMPTARTGQAADTAADAAHPAGTIGVELAGQPVDREVLGLELIVRDLLAALIEAAVLKIDAAVQMQAGRVPAAAGRGDRSDRAAG